MPKYLYTHILNVLLCALTVLSILSYVGRLFLGMHNLMLIIIAVSDFAIPILQKTEILPITVFLTGRLITLWFSYWLFT